MVDELKPKKVIFICLVVGMALLVGAVWLVTLRYNLQGGFRKKINTAKSVEASGQIDEIGAKIESLKENFKTSQEQINKLIKKQ